MSQRNVANMASPYVPVESWVYPAFALLAANGYVQSAFFDLRPWTRLDCARLIEEADDLSTDHHVKRLGECPHPTGVLCGDDVRRRQRRDQPG